MMSGRLWRPTLVQRVFLAVLLAFVFVLLALQAYMYVNFRQSLAVDQGLSKLGRSLTQAISQLDDEAGVRAVIVSTETIYKTLRISGNPPGTLRFQLWDRGGRLVYSSPGIQGELLAGPLRQVTTQDIGGEPYWVYQDETPHWSLRLAEPERTFAKVLHNNTRNMLPYLLLAFPIVLLPVWLAVKHGLRPLRRLADGIGNRKATDLSPLGVDPPYAELRPLTSALERMLQQLRDKVQRERAFVHDAAHELRTPMAVIAAQAHALAGAGTGEDRARAQAHLEQAIARASHLTQQLLDLALLDEAQPAAPRRIDVAQLAREILAQSAPRAMTRRIELTFDAADNLGASIDVPAFQSILENLLNNAIRYLHDGGQVAVTLRAEDEGMVLTVADDGPGIPATEREQVFERFYRGAGHEASGSGLGLSIVRQAVARMEGRVEVTEGLSNKGVAFRVVLPVVSEG
ncbi:sensor histidine kinase [Variovorax paradoxus]|jgi:signal transduction histidine kinase|uniref:sensor histidine kinase n=1 Tax=Variovorax paradoxus TaxID=34073 RepID=UPI002789DA06|nr:ATP-binding protein [Variovorax paradoxus]MDP9932361.1 signal transduction histidine kinase [Variovorax paradoxus]